MRGNDIKKRQWLAEIIVYLILAIWLGVIASIFIEFIIQGKVFVSICWGIVLLGAIILTGMQIKASIDFIKDVKETRKLHKYIKSLQKFVDENICDACGENPKADNSQICKECQQKITEQDKYKNWW